MKKITIISILILFTIPVVAQNTQDKYVEWAKEFSEKAIIQELPDYHGLIVKRANEEWESDYSMVAYEIKKQCKALYGFLALEKPNRMPEGTFSEIKARARLKWGDVDFEGKILKADWAMILYETKKQVKAYLEIF